MSDEDPNDQFTRFIKIKYRSVGGFQLPVKVEYREHTYNQKSDEKDFELVLTFDGFKIE
jgi:hypothetical protein